MPFFALLWQQGAWFYHYQHRGFIQGKKFFKRLLNGLHILPVESFDMHDPAQGLYIPRMIFISMTRFAPGSVCLVIANSFYDMSRSFRSRDEYLRFVNA